jgi:2-polyprenyl-6-methoxyphenol hydroxylase-like FAD-dependent oxidoreductase
MADLALKLLIGAEGGASTVAQLAAVQKSIEQTAAQSPGITKLAWVGFNG